MIPMYEAAATHGIKPDNIFVSVNNYKTNHGKLPPWYKVEGRKAFVDVDLMFQKSRIENKAWNIATDTEGLYWALRLYINDSTIAAKLAARSYLFRSKASWNQFLTTAMWNIPESGVVRVSAKKTPPMIVNFIRHAMDILYGLIKRYGIREWEMVA